MKIKYFRRSQNNFRVPRDQNKNDFLELSIPFVPEQSAALALATFRSLLRAPEVKMAWGSSFIVRRYSRARYFFSAPTSHLPDAVKPFTATGSIVFSVFFLAQFFVNSIRF